MSSVKFLMPEVDLRPLVSGVDLELEPLRRDTDYGIDKLTLVHLRTFLSMSYSVRKATQ
jgi:hypothetical protein